MAVRASTRLLSGVAGRLLGGGRVRRIARGLARTTKWGAAIGGLLLVWGAAIEPRLVDEVSRTALVPALPPSWEGARVALIADLQVGMWLANTDTVRRMVERVIEGRPAAVLIAGDFLYHPTEEAGEPHEARAELEPDDAAALRDQIARVVSMLRPLVDADIRTIAVLGNHDYGMRWPDSLPLPRSADELTSALRAAGIVVLRNEVAPLGVRDAQAAATDRLYVAGLDAWFPHATNVVKARAHLPDGAPVMWLMHNPLAFTRLPPGEAPLAFAAHTHGGQVRLPFTRRWSWMSLVKEAPVAADGWIAGFGAPGNRLYVNRGIGFSLIPVRINCRPELTWFRLLGAERQPEGK